MDSHYDAIVIGAGHNGLVCANYLAAGGLSVVVIERSDTVGGAAITEEFHPGFRNSVASYTVGLLHPKVLADLRLAMHGLRIVERPMANFLPLSNQAGDYLAIGAGLAATQAQLRRFSERDAQRLPDYYAYLETVARLVRALLLQTPPKMVSGLDDWLRWLRLAKPFRRLSLTERQAVLELLTASAGDILNRWFESDAVKAALGFDSIVGSFQSPFNAGSGYVLLHHVFGEINGKSGVWGHAIGGMGAITEAMAAEARRRGVTIITERPVAEVLLTDCRVAGVRTADGATFSASIVASSVNPKLLYQHLLAADVLERSFAERIAAYRCQSGSFRMNVALTELPRFDCLAEPGEHLRSGIVIGPSLDYMEQAYFDARQSGWSVEPVVELLIPSLVDPTLAPSGQHVASLFCQHFNPDLGGERDWDDHKSAVADLIIATVDRYAPNFSASVLARQVLSPQCLERRFGLLGGDIFHGCLSWDQLFSARPVLGYGDYRGPFAGLYHCGSGAHPGGGVTGIPGHNAAREILKDRRWCWRWRDRAESTVGTHE